MNEHIIRVIYYPSNSHDSSGLANSAPADGADWMNDCQVAIKSHENESVDASVYRHRPRILIDLQQTCN